MERARSNTADLSMYTPKPTEQGLLHFKLEGLLQLGQILAVHTRLYVFTLIASDDSHPHPFIKEQEQFTASELSLLVPMFSSHPHYCPYEVLLANFNNRKITEDTVSRWRQQMHKALEEGFWDYEMRPLRNVLSRARPKLRCFGIEITSVLETGYTLIPQSKPQSRSS